MSDLSKTLGRQQAMHESHGTWKNDHAAWHDDVRAWCGQYQRALAELSRIEALIRDHAAAIEEHGASLAAHERAVGAHEHELADLQGKGLGEQYDPRTPDHEASILRHARESEQHGRLRSQHHQVVALVKRLRELSLELPRP